jgi:TM2 domain-containing membrane protein YozV
MASNVVCGRCGTLLGSPATTCYNCGAALQWTASAKPRKRPLVAAALGIVPGLGHIYLGHYRKGAGLMTGTALLQFFGLDLDLTAVGAVLGVPLEMGGFSLWVFSIIDAYRTAKRMSHGNP